MFRGVGPSNPKRFGATDSSKLPRFGEADPHKPTMFRGAEPVQPSRYRSVEPSKPQRIRGDALPNLQGTGKLSLARLQGSGELSPTHVQGSGPYKPTRFREAKLGGAVGELWRNIGITLEEHWDNIGELWGNRMGDPRGSRGGTLRKPWGTRATKPDFGVHCNLPPKNVVFEFLQCSKMLSCRTTTIMHCSKMLICMLKFSCDQTSSSDMC